MAKRSRLTARPGQRAPLQRSSARPAAGSSDRPAGSVTREEEARAAELEAAILAQEQVAGEARRPGAAGPRGRRIGSGTGIESVGGVSYTSIPLSVRAADEYAYVKRDIRRIAIVGGFLIAILAVLEVLVNGMKLFTL